MSFPKIMIVIAALCLFLGCQKADHPAAEITVKQDAQKEDLVNRGKYLVTVAACNDCHTPFKMGPNGPEPDMSRLLSGHPENLVMPPPSLPENSPWIMLSSGTNTAYAGPWGISYAINLTPDQNTGLGIWNEEMFIKAMRTGKHFGTSRPIQPPMPWPNYAKMTEEDLKAIFTYLQSIPPITNHVPDYAPPAAAQ
jgi:mono/diheme cytochrome c family protein